MTGRNDPVLNLLDMTTIQDKDANNHAIDAVLNLFGMTTIQDLPPHVPQ